MVYCYTPSKIYNTSLVVWNPCTGQTKWIPAKDPYKTCYGTFALGSYQDKKSGYNSYKIVSYDNGTETKTKKFSVYEFKSNSWKILDVTLDFYLIRIDTRVSFKGKTYWFAVDKKENHHAIFLLSFDYTTERFGRMINLPYQLSRYISWTDMALSVVRDEKLFVVIQLTNTSRTEVWVTNKIDEIKVVPWSMVMAVDHSREYTMCGVRFLVDEEKKFVVCFDWKSLVKDGEVHYENMVHIIKEDNKVTKVDFAAPTMFIHWPQLFNYVPSLVQIQ